MSGALAVARVEATAMGIPLEIEPHEAILQCIRIAAGEVRYCSDRIAELYLDDAVGPIVSRKRRPLSHGKDGESATETVEEVTSGPPELHVWVRARQVAMDRLVNFSKIALAAGVEERRVTVAERHGQAMAELIRGVLGDLGVPLDEPRTREVVTRRLMLIDGGGAA
ncbi:hypothetical protein [Baekduia alba]|uniref:hypothetical protein n=1 Tax=Baekduia alba TaxID=2997333 RepID=UPI00234137D8|nr:hypothetical protein [Baekduia alba]